MPPHLSAAIGAAVAFVALCLVVALGLRLAAEALALGVAAAWAP